MNKNTPLARFLRTVVFGLAGIALAAGAIDWAKDYKKGSTVLGLLFIADLLAGLIAALQVMMGWAAQTPFMKAVVSFTQLEGAGLATLGISELTKDSVVNFVQALVQLTIASALAAVAAGLQNAAEDKPIVLKA